MVSLIRCLLASCVLSIAALGGADSPEKIEFVLTADMREFTAGKYAGPGYFEGACQAIKKQGAGDFMISPGDIDPPQDVRKVLDRTFGTEYPWHAVVGNHEAETASDMRWLRAWGSRQIPGLVRRGPAGSETTTYSFDHGPAHFVVLNQYFDGKTDDGGKGDVITPLYEWLKADLEATTKPIIFVIGHEPIMALPDMHSGRLRHEKDSLNMYPENSERFRRLLADRKITAYICAHTHNASFQNLGGVWQVDVGHARGKGDTGAPSTYVRVKASETESRFEFYRQLKPTGSYKRTHKLVIPATAEEASKN